MLEAGMEAPAGPVRGEAERLRLVKPEVGAWTISWESTVSPRAEERVTAETAPGASVCPTLSRLEATHTRNGVPEVIFDAMKKVRATSIPTGSSRFFTSPQI